MKYLIIFMFMMLHLVGCENATNTTGSESIMMEDNVNLPSLNDITKSSWERLSHMKVYFGHQSVGNDILNGIQKLMDKHPDIQLKIVKSNKSKDYNQALFGHSSIGENEKPLTKSNAFRNIVGTDLKGLVDIAFFKYCFIDFNRETNVSQVFNNYSETISEIKKSNPDALIVHFTTPLTTVQTGLKAWIKKVIGRSIGGVESNIVRNRYNRMLIEKYAATDVIFDLAKYESTTTDGKRQTFSNSGEIFYSLVPGYTNDGGHLNEFGQVYIAEKLLLTLVHIAENNDVIN